MPSTPPTTGAEHARECRRRKALALRTLGTQRAALRAALSVTPEALKTASIHEVLLACPGIGRIKARRILEAAQVWPYTTMAELTDEERYLLLQHHTIHRRSA